MNKVFTSATALLWALTLASMVVASAHVRNTSHAATYESHQLTAVYLPEAPVLIAYLMRVLLAEAPEPEWEHQPAVAHRNYTTRHYRYDYYPGKCLRPIANPIPGLPTTEIALPFHWFP